jgi:hypothetical protein
VACDSPPPNCVEVPGIAYVHTRRRSEADVARASELFLLKKITDKMLFSVLLKMSVLVIIFI